jgi:hypothetical protein
MKTFIRTITVFVALNLAMTSSTLAQNALEEAPQVGPAVILATQAPKTPSVPEPPPPIALIASTWPSQYRGSGAVLVIPTAQMKPQDLAAITQDLNVMSRIFDKNLQQAHIAPVSGGFFTAHRDVFSTFFTRDKLTTEAIYLEGFGTLFLVKVKFPLAPPLEVQEEKSEEDIDPVWMQTKQEIYMPDSARRFASRIRDHLTEDYNTEKVEDLKRTLIEALKHAANIRNLEPDDLVTVVVSGSEPGIAVRSIHVSSRSESVTSQRPPRLSEMTSLAPTFLTILAKKSDIDAFSKDELNYDQFRQRTQIFTY